MKKTILIFGTILVIGLICSNIYISISSESKFKTNFEFLNTASAQTEEDSSFQCYSNMSPFTGSRVLECNTPCCYRAEMMGNCQPGGLCSGPFGNCS